MPAGWPGTQNPVTRTGPLNSNGPEKSNYLGHARSFVPAEDMESCGRDPPPVTLMAAGR